MNINGIAHIQLTVADFAAARAFYGALLPYLGLKPVLDVDGAYYYCVGARTGVAISPVDDAHQGDRFAQRRVGLHHVCFRARERADVDAVHAFALSLGSKSVHAPEDAPSAPGYYSALFEDPDGIRIEINHVPGKGLLAGPPGTDGG
ncbi:MAG TPA: VOC family protein [Polyangiaceae bacterium]|nr:VOC family protein [Polyangiaceae bacterium]